MLLFWRALFVKLLGLAEAWRQRRERDNFLKEGVQDDARIADQAAAIDVLKRAVSPPARVRPDERKGRRPSAPKQ